MALNVLFTSLTDDCSYDPKRRVLTLAVILDEVSAVADYKMSLNIGGLLAAGQSADAAAVQGRASSGEITNRLSESLPTLIYIFLILLYTVLYIYYNIRTVREATADGWLNDHVPLTT